MANTRKPSLREILKAATQEELDKPCKDYHLCELALSIVRWRSLAPFLGLSEVEEDAIAYKYRDDLVAQSIAVLRKWKEKNGSNASYKRLAKVLWKFGNTELVEKLTAIMIQSSSDTSDSDSSSSTVAEKGKGGTPNVFSSYARYLKGRYLTQIPHFFAFQWPPPLTRKFFNLAMIEKQCVQRAIDEKLLKLLLHGNVDEVTQTKAAVELGNIFMIDRAYRKVILIEGAPGAGKSMLAWHICQKCMQGELFQEYEVAIFVQLHDPAIQAATSLADIIPAKSKAMAEEVLSEMEKVDGYRILYVLDGWDEYRPQDHLESESVIHKLVQKPESLNMHFSSLIITARPVGSGDLHRFASSRLVIAGFTLTEMQQYFVEAVGGNLQIVQKLEAHLKEHPLIKASCYLPLNAAVVVHLFLAQSCTLPTTLQGVFSSVVLSIIIRHVTKHKKGIQFRDISSLKDLPECIRKNFNNLCALAYHGVKENKVTFAAEELRSFNLLSDTSVATLSLVQGVESFSNFHRCTSYTFLHLSIQELLAAYHISCMLPTEQLRVFKELLGNPHFVTVFRFYATFTKLCTEGIHEVISVILHRERYGRGNELILHLLHCVYECQDPSTSRHIAAQLNRELNLHKGTLNPVDYVSVGYFLGCICSTTCGEFKVDLSMCSVDDSGISLLVKELSKNCSRQTVPRTLGCLQMILNGNHLTGNGVNSIAELVQSSSAVSKLDLSGNQIQTQRDGFSDLLQALKSNSSLTELRIHGGRNKTKLISITESNMLKLKEMISQNRSLQLLDLSSNGFSTQEIAYVATALSESTTLRSLDLSHNGPLSEEAIAAISHLLKHSLHDLNISSCGIIDARCAVLLAQGLKETFLTCLNISDSEEIGDEGNAHICNGLAQCISLKELKLGSCGMGIGGASALAHVLANSRSLIHVDISNNQKIQDEGITPICAALKCCNTLKDLNIRSCGISKVGATLLAQALADNMSIAHLDVSNNRQVCDDGIAEISNALMVNTTLKELNVSGCGLTASGISHLAHVLESNTPLHILDVSDNEIRNVGATMLADALESNQHLKELHIHGCRLTGEGLKSISKALEENNSLEFLDLSDNFVVNDGVAALGTSLKKNRQLRILKVEFLNTVASEFVKDFILCLQCNDYLTDLVVCRAAWVPRIQQEIETVNQKREQRGVPLLTVSIS